jgi:N-formylglutamate amidohydrolase
MKTDGDVCVMAELDPPFELVSPANVSAPVLFSSPHSGRIYPKSFRERSRLPALTLRRSEDAYVDLLFAGVTRLGMPLAKAHFPRAYVDVNREPYELDPEMFAGALPMEANTRSLRVAGGLGTIPRIVAEAAEIYRGPLPVAEAHERIERLYLPYHRLIAETLQRLRDGFGVSLLIDCHSMPSAARGQRPPRPDFVLGDRFGTSCAAEFIDGAERSLRRLGYTVARNRPYAGGYITQAYGRPGRGLHALQIEINRGLYLDERSISPLKGFGALRDSLEAFAADLRDLVPQRSGGLRDAAE